MASKIFTKQGDTWTPIQVNADLTGGTVRVIARPSGSDTSLPDLAFTITNVTKGALNINTEDLPVGAYQLEVELLQAGARYTFPNRDYTILVVIADLDA